MTLDLIEPRTEQRRPPALPHWPALTPDRPAEPAFLPPEEPGFPAAHAYSPSPAWAAPGTPEALIEQRLAHANAHVADPAARVARTLCVFVACAREHAEVMRRLAPRFLSTAAAQSLRIDVATGQLEGRFTATGLAAGSLAAVGVADIALRRALDHGAEPGTPHIVRELAFGLLRALGLPDTVACDLARDAVEEILNPIC